MVLRKFDNNFSDFDLELHPPDIFSLQLDSNILGFVDYSTLPKFQYIWRVQFNIKVKSSNPNCNLDHDRGRITRLIDWVKIKAKITIKDVVERLQNG